MLSHAIKPAKGLQIEAGFALNDAGVTPYSKGCAGRACCSAVVFKPRPGLGKKSDAVTGHDEHEALTSSSFGSYSTVRPHSYYQLLFRAQFERFGSGVDESEGVDLQGTKYKGIDWLGFKKNVFSSPGKLRGDYD